MGRKKEAGEWQTQQEEVLKEIEKRSSLQPHRLQDVTWEHSVPWRLAVPVGADLLPVAFTGWSEMVCTPQPAQPGLGFLLASQEAVKHTNSYKNTNSTWMLMSRQSSKYTTSQLKCLNQSPKLFWSGSWGLSGRSWRTPTAQWRCWAVAVGTIHCEPPCPWNSDGSPDVIIHQ